MFDLGRDTSEGGRDVYNVLDTCCLSQLLNRTMQGCKQAGQTCLRRSFRVGLKVDVRRDCTSACQMCLRQSFCVVDMGRDCTSVYAYILYAVFTPTTEVSFVDVLST